MCEKRIELYLGPTDMHSNLKKDYRLIRDVLPPNIQ